MTYTGANGNRSLVPVAVNLNATTIATDVSAGGAHTCALISGGGEMCWGRNLEDQLGNGNNTDSANPVTNGATTVVAVSAGANHTCDVNAAGQIYCWGSNTDGQIGADPATIPSRNSPAQITGLTIKVTGIAAGAATTCLINEVGTVACWGKNDLGQLGNGLTVANTFAVGSIVTGTGPAVGSAPAVFLSQFTNNHVCLIMQSGVARCWGNGAMYQLGNGNNTSPRRTPVNVVGFP